jgi:hypothetical protein
VADIGNCTACGTDYGTCVLKAGQNLNAICSCVQTYLSCLGGGCPSAIQDAGVQACRGINNQGFCKLDCTIPTSSPVSPSTPSAPSSDPCASPDGTTCSYYANCLESKQKCDLDGYAVGFGGRMCTAFLTQESTAFTENGVAWSAAVRQCVQIALAKVIPDPASVSCSDIESIAVAVHVGCYEGVGFCSLSASDQYKAVQMAQAAFPLTTRSRDVIAKGLLNFGVCTNNLMSSIEVRIKNEISSLTIANINSIVTNILSLVIDRFDLPKESFFFKTFFTGSTVFQFGVSLTDDQAKTLSTNDIYQYLLAQQVNGTLVESDYEVISVTQSTSSSTLSAGAIAGIVVGGVAALLLIIVILAVVLSGAGGEGETNYDNFS